MDIDYDADGQWELLKHSIPGYAAVVESRDKARLESYLKEERQRGLAEIDELLKSMEEPVEDRVATRSSTFFL